MTLIFGCACGETFDEADYAKYGQYAYGTYRDVVNAHRERCTKAARRYQTSGAPGVAPPAEPIADSPQQVAPLRGVEQASAPDLSAGLDVAMSRPVRPATGVEPSQAPPVATQTPLVDRIRGAFILCVGFPTIAAAWIASIGRGLT